MHSFYIAIGIKWLVTPLPLIESSYCDKQLNFDVHIYFLNFNDDNYCNQSNNNIIINKICL